MNITQSNLFKQSYKKLHKNQVKAVNEAIQLVISNPAIGELKSGDLANVRVHKFKFDTHLYLLAYEYEEQINLLYLIALGEHENFYKKLKSYIK